MTKEDVLLMQRCETALHDLHEEYDTVERNIEDDEAPIDKQDIYLEILTCETIIKECQAEVDASSLDEIEANLNMVYHMKLGQMHGDENTLLKLDQVTSKFLCSSKHKQNVDEKLLTHYREDIDLISGIKSILNDRLNIVQREKRWIFFHQTVLISKYEAILEAFSTLEQEILECFTFMSDLITTHIVESVHYLYLYFAYIIKYFLHTNNQLILVEIAASIDRFINVMQPLKKTATLKNENLRNFYVIYEFKVLKDLIIQHYE